MDMYDLRLQAARTRRKIEEEKQREAEYEQGDYSAASMCPRHLTVGAYLLGERDSLSDLIAEVEKSS